MWEVRAFWISVCLAVLIGGMVVLPCSGYSQSRIRQFRELPGPLKRWTLSHLWVAGRAQRVSARALVLADSMRVSPELDGDWNGGSLDAFRHGIWMALLVQRMSEGKARRLGDAYEKWNYQQFLLGELEDGLLPDRASSIMDQKNNDEGIHSGLACKRNGDCPEKDLILEILEGIELGSFYVIFKDSAGNSLDYNGKVIPPAEWQGKWVNGRVALPADIAMKRKRDSPR
jgi:hypothetical protein